MSEERKPENKQEGGTVVKIAVPTLPCGHEASFEHEFVEGMLTIANLVSAQGKEAIEPCMDYVRKLFEYYYLPLPSYDEMVKIRLSHHLDSKNKEVN